MKIITDKRTLNGIKNAGYIQEPEFCSFPRVEETAKSCWLLGFEYKNKKYKFKYFDGNFYPYLIEV